MKSLKINLFLIGLLLLCTACTKDFDEINEDPNRISKISPGTLLNPIIYGLADHNADRSAKITFDLMQVSLPYPSPIGGLHRYDVSPSIGNSSWYHYYKWLNNIREMRIAANKYNAPNYKAIALTLNALVYSYLTDLFGPVPMREASQAEAGILYPKFNTQQEIYQTILEDLKQANNLYDPEVEMIYGDDILFHNDVLKWQKFTNSLRLRLLLRISNQPETQAWEKLKAIITNPAENPVFESTEESAILKVTGVTPNVSPWGRPQDFRLSTKLSSFFIDHLKLMNDPRLAYIATQAENTNNELIGYKGIPSAYDGPESQFDYNASTFTIEQVIAPMEIFFLTYAEVEFIKAEVALKGYIPQPELHYKNGIRAGIEQFELEFPENYFDTPYVQYNGTLAQIMLQKYFALYFTDYQQWFEYRRTGFPELPKTHSMFNNGIMPSRFYYPQDVKIHNYENYQKALQLLGSDDINTKVWWDKNN